jgi:adenosylmethionine-8-amino-7-oxononanoate aminotransferase
MAAQDQTSTRSGPRASLAARDRAAFWHPCGQMRDYDDFPPLEVVGAAGSRLRLADGREILDAISSWWCKALGHGHPHLLAALRAQAGTFEHVITANTTSAPLVRFCERLLAAANGADATAWGPDAPPGRRTGHFGKVFLADSGSMAVEIALKMALQAQAQRGQRARTRFAALANGYHGETVGALSVGDCELYAAPYRGLTFPVQKLAGLPYRTGPEDARWMDAGREWPAIERALDAEASTLAAVIYEPVLQAAGQMRLYSPDLLRRLRAWADARGVYLIADEIAAGMGRLGAILASHLGDGPGRVSVAALPDFATLSKGLTGGVLPLSAVLTTDAVAGLFEGDWAEGRAFLHSNTYTGHALGVAVANAVLDVFASDDILGRVAAVGPSLRAALDTLVARRPDLPLAGARGCGMMAAIDLRGAGGAPLPPGRRTGYRVYREAVRRGVLLRPIGDTMYLFPPLTVEAADVREMVDVLEASVEAVARAP